MSSPESSIPEEVQNFKAPDEGSQREHHQSPWKKVRKIIEASALAALASGLHADIGQAAEKLGKEQTSLQRIELARNESKIREQTMMQVVREHGRAGKLTNLDIREYTTPDSNTVMVGYDARGQEIWLSFENNDASMRVLDSNLDGSPDRIVLNKETTPLGTAKKSSDNTLRSFSSLASLSEEAHVVSAVRPEHTSVFAVEPSQEHFNLRAIDFQTGETSILEGDDADQLVESLQHQFSSSLEIKPSTEK